MSILSRFRILTKILAVIILMAAIAIGITVIGTNALKSANEGANNMSAASKRAFVAARAYQNVIALNRAEFRAALDPRQENRAEVRKIVDEQLKMFRERI